MKEKLIEARQYEKKHLHDADQDRPRFHLTPATGWCNDPNGFSVYKGEYHLFYQYYPYDVVWGPMHWGHAKTKDFIIWEYLPAVLAPEDTFDDYGCFSGSAMELDDDFDITLFFEDENIENDDSYRHLIIYTGCYEGERTKAEGISYQQQCIAIGDGVDYIKIDKNPVVGAELVPEGNSIIDFRDPKIWKEEDTYYMIVANRLPDESGGVLLYQSENILDWEYVAQIECSENIYGHVWECPDLFSLDGKYIMISSPQEMKGDGKEFYDGYSNLALVGDYDKEKKRYHRESVQTLDYGTDFYAPQSLKSVDGRRIMIGWMQNWDAKDYKMTGKRFFGEMTMARELSVKNGRVCQTPVRELENYHGMHYNYSSVLISQEERTFQGVEGTYYDMRVRAHLIQSGKNDFTISLRRKDDSAFTLRYDSMIQQLVADRSQAGIPQDYVCERYFPALPTAQNHLDLRIIVDRYSVEIFVNEGESVASFLIHTEGEEITFSATDPTIMDIDFYELKR